MRKWGTRSKAVYNTLDIRLQHTMDTVLQEVADVSLITGFRDRVQQEDMVRHGKSQLHFPYSKHNRQPSIAVDFQPYPYPAREVELWAALAYIAGAAVQIAKRNGTILRWGGDWDRDGDLTDNNFDDLFHLEIVE